MIESLTHYKENRLHCIDNTQLFCQNINTQTRISKHSQSREGKGIIFPTSTNPLSYFAIVHWSIRNTWQNKEDIFLKKTLVWKKNKSLEQNQNFETFYCKSLAIYKVIIIVTFWNYNGLNIKIYKSWIFVISSFYFCFNA